MNTYYPILCLIIIVILGNLLINVSLETYKNLSSDIPRNILQVWIGPNPIPKRFIEAKKTIIKLNPNWNYYFLNTKQCEEFVYKNFPELLNIYLGYPYDIQRADAIRYMFLYLYGGIYIDLDYIAQRSFDTLTLGDYEIGLLPEPGKNMITNSFIISKPKSVFLLAVLKKLEMNTIPKYSIGKHLIVMNSTGPVMISKIYEKYKKKVKILSNISTNCTTCKIIRHECIPKNTDYIVPIEGKSWHSLDSSIYNSIYCMFY